MKTKLRFIACACLVYLSCGRNPAGNAYQGADLSAQDLSDIALLAAHFSQRHIDTISAGYTSYRGHWAPLPYRENDFTGYVQFDSIYTDTDKVSYQNLRFYNRFWYAYAAYKPSNSEIVFVNDWYSCQSYFSAVEKTVFKIDTLTIIASLSGELGKTAVVGLFDTILAAQTDTADTNHSKIPADFSLANTTNLYSYTSNDSTFLNISTGNHIIYRTTFVAGELRNVFVEHIVFVVPESIGRAAIPSPLYAAAGIK
jgi:hypothetical protein